MKLFIIFLVVVTSLPVFSKDASIVLMRGEVFVNGKQADKKIDLVYGDKVEARGEKSFVQILFNTGSKLMLKNGLILLERFQKDGSTINLIKGTLFSYVNKAAKKDFRVKTHHAAMAVRGTKFFVEEKDEETYLCVCEGIVRIQNKIGQRDVKKGEDVHATKKAPLLITKASDMMWKMSIEAFKEMDLPLQAP